MRVTSLVTGGAGFIGSHLVDLLLKKKHKVIVVDDFSGGRLENLIEAKKNKNLTIIKQDILKKKLTISGRVDYIFHLAGKGDIVPSIVNPSLYFDTNVKGTLNILEFARQKKIKKFVYAASSSCYGIAKTPTDEKAKIKCEYPYALSKYMGEQLVFHWSKVYNIKVNSIRIFNAYGKRVKTTGAYGAVFGVFFKQILEKKPLTVVANGKQKRDFVNVKDVVNAFYLAAVTKINNEIFNLGNNDPQSINKLIKIIGYNKKIFLPKRPGEPNITWANNKKITKKLGWKPKIKFEDGVNEMINDINKWKNAPLWNKRKIKAATSIWFRYLKK